MQVSPILKTAAGLKYLEKRPVTGPVRKLAVLLHGYGRDASLMQKLADELALRVPAALVVMPQGAEPYEDPRHDADLALPVPEQLRGDDPDGLQSAARRQWFSIRAATIDEMSVGLLRATQQINDFISVLLSEHDLQDADAGLMGFSQGGVLALYTAYRRPQALSCVVGHSALFMGGDDLCSCPPTMYLYGLDDEEFTPQRYEREAQNLLAYANKAHIQAVPGLRHTTNAQSRAIVADYMAGYLQ